MRYINPRFTLLYFTSIVGSHWGTESLTAMTGPLPKEAFNRAISDNLKKKLRRKKITRGQFNFKIQDTFG